MILGNNPSFGLHTSPEALIGIGLVPLTVLMENANHRILALIVSISIIIIYLMQLPLISGCVNVILWALITLAISRASGKKKKILFISILALIGGCAAWLVIRYPHLSEQLIVLFTRGKSDPSGRGYSAVVVDEILALSRLGSRADIAAADIVPDAGYSFALILLIAEFGITMGIWAIVLCVIVSVLLFLYSIHIKNALLRFISLSASVMFSIQVTTGILASFCLIPNSKFHVPFLARNPIDSILISIVLGCGIIRNSPDLSRRL
jgi:cell division protein FtsW (lipid II flippase)